MMIAVEEKMRWIQRPVEKSPRMQKQKRESVPESACNTSLVSLIQDARLSVGAKLVEAKSLVLEGPKPDLSHAA
jgi:hypothetical protein